MRTYFIQAQPSGAIKIGTARRPRQRLMQIAISCPEEVCLLGSVDGNIEGSLHERFAAYRTRGEWFRPSPDLLAFVSEHSASDHVEAGPEIKPKLMRIPLALYERVEAAAKREQRSVQGQILHYVELALSAEVAA